MVLRHVFKVELYSLRITGGLILFMIGWTAVREGRFVQKREHNLREDFTELSLVPLAAPLIAGPGTIAAAISAGTAQEKTVTNPRTPRKETSATAAHRNREAAAFPPPSICAVSAPTPADMITMTPINSTICAPPTRARRRRRSRRTAT